jgi:hypothetical protein
MGKESKEMDSMYRWIIVAPKLVAVFLIITIETRAQSNEGFMYGKIYMEDRTYTGPLRWGNEEVLWTDFFNASKASSQYQKMVPEKKDDDDSWFSQDWSFGSIWENKIVAHKFSCQFGNLVSLAPVGSSRVAVKFKNGGQLVVDGEGYNDVGSKIQVIDAELGAISVNWDRISKIEFLPTPSRLEGIFGTPLFGTVEGIRKEKITGYIVWDDDERLSTDRLDGDDDDDDDDVSIKFAEISEIEKEGRGSRVTLKSGKSMYLTGSNDVNSENRGVLVAVPEVGVIRFSWRAFRKVTFTKPTRDPQSYSQFTAPMVLKGTVSQVEGDDLSGRIIYDIDETLNFEILEGKENDIEYSIPMKNIRSITPKNYEFSSIELRNKEELLLGDGQDVSSRNAGVLVFVKGKKTPEYVSWKKINAITFD